MQQSMLAESAAQGEGMDDLGVGLQKHESQLLTLAQQLTLLRMEVEEVGSRGWRRGGVVKEGG